MQRAKRIGPLPSEWRPAIPGQRLRQDQQTVQRIGEAQGRGDPERQPGIHAPEKASDRRPQDESGPESSADLAEHRRALVRRCHIRNIGKCGGNARRGDARNQPAHKEPAQRWRQCHQDIIQREPEIRQQYHGTAAEPVRQGAENRRKQELHQRPSGAEQAENPRGPGCIVIDKALHELRQDRHDQAERQHVEQDGDEDKGYRRTAYPRLLGRRSSRVWGFSFVHDGRLRL